MRGPVLRGSSRAAIVVTLGIGLTGCATDAGCPSAASAPPLAVVLATQASDAAGVIRAGGRRQAERPARPRSGFPAVIGGLPQLAATPTAPSRARSGQAAALRVSAARRLATPACATYRDALAGRLPAVVARRDGTRALAVVTHGVAAALLGLPIDVPAAARAERKRLATAQGALTDALGETADAAADATAASTRTGLRAYAAALGIDDCG